LAVQGGIVEYSTGTAPNLSGLVPNQITFQLVISAISFYIKSVAGYVYLGLGLFFTISSCFAYQEPFETTFNKFF
jgi:hypothetical protein